MDRNGKTASEKREAAIKAVERLKIELNDWAKLQLERFNFTEKTEIYDSPGQVRIYNPNGFTLTFFASGVVSLGNGIF